ncbi:MAG: hypothetical protein A4E52_01280 [Pelotomaculum sp. PtaB.Bin013]|nr:MAG: hypothetical protein A4E52_01280 [Pelotomaculum sp. PtaB.Bin013]
MVKAVTERADSVLEFKKYGYDSWRKVYQYGRRWVGRERLFGNQAHIWRDCEGDFDGRHIWRKYVFSPLLGF